MLRTTLAAIMCATALASAPVLAQTGAGSDADTKMRTQQPAATDREAAPTMKDGNAAMDTGHFLLKQSADQTLTNEFAGVEVLVREGDSLEAIGEIEQVIVGGDQQIVGAIVEVGGFLGIGTKPVALKWSQLQRIDRGGETAFVIAGMTAERLEDAPPFMAMAEDKRPNTGIKRAPAPLNKTPGDATQPGSANE